MTASADGGVVVHLDEGDPAKHTAVLRNIANLIDALGEQTPIELVVHGAGITAALRDGDHAGRLRDLQERGLVVAACRNTLRSEDIAPERLLAGAVVVPAGIAHLVLRQRQGWAYVRP